MDDKPDINQTSKVISSINMNSGFTNGVSTFKKKENVSKMVADSDDDSNDQEENIIKPQLTVLKDQTKNLAPTNVETSKNLKLDSLKEVRLEDDAQPQSATKINKPNKEEPIINPIKVAGNITL